MPHLTSGERQALTWLLAVIGVGAGVRVASHLRERDSATPSADAALRRQLVAVDSAQRAGQRQGRPRRAGRVAGRGSARAALAPAPDQEPPTVLPPPQVPTLAPVDLDMADSALLERLPRIGPSLAGRIVADRARNGPFGSIEALQRVRGIGPKLSAGLASIVTFSGNPRPSAVQR